MTYEHLKAPADAPVTWDVSRDKRGEYQWNLSDFGAFVGYALTEEGADAICRAFHKAKMAEDARVVMDRGYAALAWDSSMIEDWCRRFDAVKGDA